MTKSAASREGSALPQWIRPQLTAVIDAAPEGDQWLHEIKFDGYRMHARLDRGRVKLLTRTGLDWTHKYPAIATAVSSLPARQAYLDGEDLCGRPLFERKARLAALLSDGSSPLQYSDHQVGYGRAFHEKACAMSLEGIVSKRADAPYTPRDRGLWRKVKCLHPEEFVLVGWTDPEGARPWLGALLLAYYDPHGKLVYAGRVGAGINATELERLWRRLQLLATSQMPLEVAPPRSARIGLPLVLSRVHWVRPELVVEVKFLTWTEDNLLRQVVYQGLREDKPAAEVRREQPHPKAASGSGAARRPAGRRQ